MRTRFVLACFATVLLLACDDAGTRGSGGGGATASGGSSAGSGGGGTGGLSASGGRSSAGGSTDKGGNAGESGAAGHGGAIIDGGSSGSGGFIRRGGTTGAAGSAAKGGSTGRGGTAGSGGAPGSGGGSGSGPVCTREMLQAAVNSYLAAMQAGDPSSLPLDVSATYTENGARTGFGQGLWERALPAPDLHMSLLDVEKCGSYTEVIIAGGPDPYVLGVRLTVTRGQISAVAVIATDCDDWGFNASSYLRYAKAEQTNTAPGSGWGPVPPDDQLGRAELEAAGDAYFAYWADKTVSVPWGYPCSRLEGGVATNPDPNPNKSSTCSVGIPDQSFAPKANDYLVDVDRGMVVLFLNLPGPDSHWFRITKSALMRYIHTLTICYVNGTWQCPGNAPACS